MSELRPIQKGTNKPKRFEDYTPEEEQSALTQLTDSANQRLAAGRTVDKRTAERIVKLAEKHKKTEALDERIVDAASVSADKSPKK